MSFSSLLCAVLVSLSCVFPPPTNGADGVLEAAEAFQRGERAFFDGEWDDALREYNTAIKLNPKCDVSFNRRGTVWLAKGEWEKARRDCDTAIRLNPSGYGAYINRSVAFTNLGQHKAAISDLNQAMALAPDVVTILRFRGDAWRAQKEYDKAIADYTEAIRRGPQEAYAPILERGRTWYEKGNWDKAIEDATAAIDLKPKYAAPYHYSAALDEASMPLFLVRFRGLPVASLVVADDIPNMEHLRHLTPSAERQQTPHV